ncbi:MAG: DUF4258 domain-containing protein [Polyangiaceae bacterium]|nr:DUF4258 domain-containing protein [Polyangiaceae bacterium]
MKPADALQAAQAAAKTRQLLLTMHARESMAKRGVQVVDLNEAIRTAKDAIWSEKEQTWRLSGGKDSEGDDLTVVVCFDPARVITVF